MNRIVTGYGDDGMPAILFEGAPPTVDRTEKYITSELWITDTTPAPLQVVGDTSLGGYTLEPSATGTRFRVVEIAPQNVAEADKDTKVDPGTAAGVHRTDTLDYVVVLRGQVTLIVGDREVTLNPGDVAVQHGVEHDWQNRGSSPCLVAAVLIAGTR